jgi:quercetin dioxygenase-like cupin family protein
MTSITALALAILLQAQASPPPPPSSPAPSPRPAATTQARQATASTAKPGSLAITVVSETGDPQAGAMVTVHGAVDRAGVSGTDGVVGVQGLPAGTYRCRITRDGFIALDKEVTIRAGARTAAEAVLSPAPAPPPPPPPPPPAETRTVPPAGTAGLPRILSIPDLAEQMLRESSAVAERQLGCSGVAATTLIAARESLPLRREADLDVMIYMVAGDATLTMGQRDQTVSAGWFGLVPRGTSYSLTRRGRNPMVLLVVESGKPCAAGTTGSGAASPERVPRL